MLLLVSSKKKVPIETFNIPIECTQSKQQCGSKITCTEGRKIMLITIRYIYIYMCVCGFDV